ncbi:MAG: YncE family protein [Bacteroidia bacterium]
MKKNFHTLILHFCCLLPALFFFSGCANKNISIEEQLNAACYPEDVGKIFTEKCATAGCHNTQSKDGAAGLDMSSWNSLFNGARNGPAVIPYNSHLSYLVSFINTFPDLDSMKLPTMPNNSTPLSRNEVLTVINWINDGAPDCNGHRLTDNPDRKKFYITNQSCDLVSVWDADKKVIMKYITVGGNPNTIENPHKVGISPDGKYWYLSFTGLSARHFQKYRTSDDSFVGQVDIGAGRSLNTFAFTSDSKWAYIPDFNNNSIVVVDCETMTLRHDNFLQINPFFPGNDFINPHGSFISPDDHYLYVTMQQANYLYKIDLTGPIPDGFALPAFPMPSLHPHEIAFSPDGILYFVTCEASNDVLVYRVSDDAYLKSISVAGDPVEMAFSNSTDYLFVSCLTGNAVSIINYKNTTLVNTLSDVGFAEPHGIVVDDDKGLCYVVSRNRPGSGPPPHHTSYCGGRNGFMNAIDIHTLKIIPGFTPELSVDPYSITIRK